MDPDSFLPLARALAQLNVEYVLVGGLALGFQGLVRATGDIDLFVRPTEENVDRLRAALRLVYHDDSIDEIVADDLAGDYAVVRYGPPDDDYVVDIIGHIGEVWHYDDLESELLEIEGVRLNVASRRTLYRMKSDTLRPKDQMDAAALRQQYGLEESD
ncbi:MAG: hypothetical protein EB084_14415 [Proteobacteria bacterium]|nr:hypothetical protein [Pseudomonadota bacterium]